MGSALTLRAVAGEYDCTVALKDGTVTSDRVSFEFDDVVPSNRAFRPMVNDLAYDLSEMAIVTHLLAHAAGRPLTGIPAVLLRLSPLESITCRVSAGIRAPRDLEGRRLGVRAYTQTTGVWLRGILSDAYGVDLDKIQWVTSEAAHVRGFEDPPNVSRAENGQDLVAMLVAGELDGVVGLPTPPSEDLGPLFPNARADEEAFCKRTGIPAVINHLLVIKQTLADEHPWLKSEIYRLFEASADVSDARTGTQRPPSGLEPNRKAFETVARYAVEQHIIPRQISPDELYTS